MIFKIMGEGGQTHDGHSAMTIARWPLASGAKYCRAVDLDLAETRRSRSRKHFKIEKRGGGG